MLAGFIPFCIAVILSTVGQSLYQDRFFVFAHLFIVIGLAELISRIRHNRLRVTFTTLAVLGFCFAFTSFWQELSITSKPGAQAAARDLYEQRDDMAPIIVSSPFIYFSILHYAQEEYGDSSPKLYSETGELSHFAGGPILTKDTIVGPNVFEEHDEIWVVDTTGFGSSKIQLPPQWSVEHSNAYPEVFAHQADIFVSRYTRN